MTGASRAKSEGARAVFGGNVRRFRTQRGYSQEELGERAGLHRTYVSSLERGERNVGLDNIKRLAGALGVAASDLLADV